MQPRRMRARFRLCDWRRIDDFPFGDSQFFNGTAGAEISLIGCFEYSNETSGGPSEPHALARTVMRPATAVQVQEHPNAPLNPLVQSFSQAWVTL